MNNLEKFNHSVNVLLEAYLNDTLQHGNCYACAVGNLVSHACGYGFVQPGGVACWKIGMPVWQKVFTTSSGGRQRIVSSNYTNGSKRQIDSTGYTWQQLAMVEKAFESVYYDDELSDDDKMFNGLMAVVDVLAEIHNIDLTTKDEAKSLFVYEKQK